MHRYALLTAMVVCSMDAALAVDGPKWANQDPATRDWFRNLHSPSGFPCCDYVDGNRVDDPDYMENPDGSYDVTVNGKTFHVPVEKVVTATNRIGYAIFWGKPELDAVYCFMPGARG